MYCLFVTRVSGHTLISGIKSRNPRIIVNQCLLCLTRTLWLRCMGFLHNSLHNNPCFLESQFLINEWSQSLNVSMFSLHHSSRFYSKFSMHTFCHQWVPNIWKCSIHWSKIQYCWTVFKWKIFFFKFQNHYTYKLKEWK